MAAPGRVVAVEMADGTVEARPAPLLIVPVGRAVRRRLAADVVASRPDGDGVGACPVVVGATTRSSASYMSGTPAVGYATGGRLVVPTLQPKLNCLMVTSFLSTVHGARPASFRGIPAGHQVRWVKLMCSIGTRAPTADSSNNPFRLMKSPIVDPVLGPGAHLWDSHHRVSARSVSQYLAPFAAGIQMLLLPSASGGARRDEPLGLPVVPQVHATVESRRRVTLAWDRVGAAAVALGAAHACLLRSAPALAGDASRDAVRALCAFQGAVSTWFAELLASHAAAPEVAAFLQRVARSASLQMPEVAAALQGRCVEPDDLDGVVSWLAIGVGAFNLLDLTVLDPWPRLHAETSAFQGDQQHHWRYICGRARRFDAMLRAQLGPERTSALADVLAPVRVDLSDDVLSDQVCAPAASSTVAGIFGGADSAQALARVRGHRQAGGSAEQRRQVFMGSPGRWLDTDKDKDGVHAGGLRQRSTFLRDQPPLWQWCPLDSSGRPIMRAGGHEPAWTDYHASVGSQIEAARVARQASVSVVVDGHSCTVTQLQLERRSAFQPASPPLAARAVRRVDRPALCTSMNVRPAIPPFLCSAAFPSPCRALPFLGARTPLSAPPVPIPCRCFHPPRTPWSSLVLPPTATNPPPSPCLATATAV